MAVLLMLLVTLIMAMGSLRTANLEERMAGNVKDVCVTEAKAEQAKGLASAKLGKEVGTARKAAAEDMNEADRGAMIRGMVDRLATRLKQNGDDIEGWLRLVRAYMVMGERDKAASALTDARQALANDAERLRQLNEGAKNLGLDG